MCVRMGVAFLRMKGIVEVWRLHCPTSVCNNKGCPGTQTAPETSKSFALTFFFQDGGQLQYLNADRGGYWEGTSAETRSHAQDAWVEEDPVLCRHFRFSQACLCLTFANSLTLSSITIGVIKALGGQGAQESISLPMEVFRLLHAKGYGPVLEVKG